MNMIELFHTFQTQEQAIEYLEKVRWGGQPICPYCDSGKVCRHVSGDRENQRWQCQDCHRAFAVTVGTIFHRTHVPLRNWFLVLALMLNAKKSVSSCQIARDLGMRRPTVWSMMHRIRVAMAEDTLQSSLLHGIVEADETYIGGKPRKGNRRSQDKRGGDKSKRGRGTDKTPIIGVAERYGRVIATPAVNGKVDGKALRKFIDKYVDGEASLVMTDEYPAYRGALRGKAHATINHQVCYADGMTHTNTIEGFWALLKRAWYGQHHHYSKKYTALYVFEACFKYNARKNGNAFADMIGLMVAA